MTGIKISQLPGVASAQLTDIFPVVQAGITSQETLLQIKNSFFPISSPISQVNSYSITATGAFSYTPTTGTSYAIFELQGGGGGAAGSTGAGGQSASPGAGGGGAYLKLFVTGFANLNAIAGSVGTAGSAGAAGNNPGTAGGDTTLTINAGTQWVAAGGAGGAPQTSSAAVKISGAPGAGGIITNGTNAIKIIGTVGGYGGFGFSGGSTSQLGIGTPGGSSMLGTGGQLTNAGSNAGALPDGYGSGCGGPYNESGVDKGGGVGAQGIVIITEFISV